eukprot:TRINITY_DN2048_c0_g1_i2.p1 TRINITY_DN2048_c0_g1~~TRINITY_DN2048_c0_g1_i2.p1  ORF type:complete len:645 (-),score=145.35 TRINITY_DN2048_c0_g1_i2:284-2218(-)
MVLKKLGDQVYRRESDTKKELERLKQLEEQFQKNQLELEAFKAQNDQSDKRAKELQILLEKEIEQSNVLSSRLKEAEKDSLESNNLIEELRKKEEIIRKTGADLQSLVQEKNSYKEKLHQLERESNEIKKNNTELQQVIRLKEREKEISQRHIQKQSHSQPQDGLEQNPQLQGTGDRDKILKQIQEFVVSYPSSPLSTLGNLISAISPGFETNTESSSVSYIYSTLQIFLNKYLYYWTGPQIVLDDYEILERRGEKLSSPVRKVRQRNTGSFFALKQIDLPAYKPILVDIINSQPESHRQPNRDGLSTRDCRLDKLLDLELEWNYSYYSSFRELLILSSLDHVNIIKYLGVIRKQNDTIHFLMPYIQCDCDYFSRTPIMTIPNIRYITYRLLGALNYLHSAGVVHGDIQPSSVLISVSSETDLADREVVDVKLGSFGNSFHLQSMKLGPRNVNKNNICQWAPEVAIKVLKDYSLVEPFDWKKGDIWSLGATLLIIMRFGEPFFDSTCVENHLSAVMRVKECRPEQMSLLEGEDFCIKRKWPQADLSLQDLVLGVKNIGYPGPNGFKYLQPPLLNKPEAGELLDFISRTMAFDQEKRPTAQELLQHSFFESINRKSCIEAIAESKRVTKLLEHNLIGFVLDCGGV